MAVFSLMTSDDASGQWAQLPTWSALTPCVLRAMIALDTNILVRFYVDDPGDSEATKQRPIAREILTKVAVPGSQFDSAATLG